MHIKKRYENAGATKLALQRAVRKESTAIVNARKIQEGLAQMEEVFSAVGKNVSFEYVPDDDIVKISVDSQVVKIASVWGDSALTAMNDVWAVAYKYLN